MRKLWQLNQRSRAAQFRWMRNHPFQYVGLNAGLIGLLIGYYWWEERRENREFQTDLEQLYLDTPVKVDTAAISRKYFG